MDFFERIGEQLIGKLPFVAYRKPGEDLVKAIFQKDARLHELTDFTESGFVFAPFLEGDRAVFLKADIVIDKKNFFDAGNLGISKLSPEDEDPKGGRATTPVSIVARKKKVNPDWNSEGESGPPDKEPKSSEKEHYRPVKESYDSEKEFEPIEREPKGPQKEPKLPEKGLGHPEIENYPTEKERKSGIPAEPSAKSSHIALVQKAVRSIEAGDFRKVVLSRKAIVGLETSPLTLFKNLLSRYDTALCYLWFHPQVGLWLGATPEILLKTRNLQLTTMSLAGTQTFDGDLHPTWGQKEREEQRLVTDYIQDTLEGQVSHLERSETETVLAGELLHLRTRITGILKENNLGPILKALHPTPAVCGLPKKTAMDFITENEGYHREFYTGFLGELNLYDKKQRNPNRSNQENQAYRSVVKTSTLYVNLRCMQVKNGQAHIYVGGGITKDSDPEKEWEETVAKSKTILAILD